MKSATENTPATRTASEIPPLDQHPEYAPDLAKLRKLEAEEAKISGWLASANSELATLRSKNVSDLAAELIRDDKMPASVQDAETKMTELRSRLIVIRTAIEQLKATLHRRMQEISAKVCKEFFPVHAVA